MCLNLLLKTSRTAVCCRPVMQLVPKQRNYGVRPSDEVNPCKRIIDDIREKCRTKQCEEEYRFDDIYYKVSDKATKTYQQTWCEPPELVIEDKPVCLEVPKFEAIDPARRKKVVKGGAGDECGKPKTEDKNRLNLGLMECRNTSGLRGQCPRITLPGCEGARNPPPCKLNERDLPKCRMPTPYPCFSECVKDPINMIPISECNINDVLMCDAYRQSSREANVVKASPVTCQPKKK